MNKSTVLMLEKPAAAFIRAEAKREGKTLLQFTEGIVRKEMLGEVEVPLSPAERRTLFRLSKRNAITPEEIVLACVKLGLPLVAATLERDAAAKRENTIKALPYLNIDQALALPEALEFVKSGEYDKMPLTYMEFSPAASARMDEIAEPLMRRYGIDREQANTVAVKLFLARAN